MVKAVYPGSFDPITLGHVDIIERAAAVFEHLTVAVSGKSSSKSFSFSEEERMDFISRCTCKLENVEVVSFEGLLSAYARKIGAQVIVRGLRAISDFEYEFQMSSMNSELAPEVDTIFMMTRTEFSFLSSSVVKEIASYGGDISTFVPSDIREDIIEKLYNR